MACGCPVVTSDTSAMPETAGGAALLADPPIPESLAAAMVEACGPEAERLRAAGPGGRASSPGRAPRERTLDVYREVHAPHGGRGDAMRILVTGGAGFIGSHTCDRLVSWATTSSCSMR